MGIWCGWDHLRTSILFDLIDTTEYLALTANSKEYIRILLSCGNINFKSGSVARNGFTTIFPEGTTTYTNWINLLTQSEPPEVP